MTPHDQAMVNLYQGGASLATVGAVFGISGQQVRRRLAALGIPRRPRGRPEGAINLRPRASYEAVAARYHAGGVTMTGLAREYGVTYQAVRWWIRQASSGAGARS